MALTAQEVTAFLQANPGLSDAQIASLANQYGVSSSLLSEATGVPVAQIEQRAISAGTPLTGMMTNAPTVAAPTAQPVTQPAVTPAQVLPADVRAAFESQNLTQDQYDTLSRYFGNPLLMDEATRDPNKPTIKEYVNNNRSGYEFASFAATRVPKYGGTLGTAAEKDQLGKLGALVAPYIGAESGPIIDNGEGGLSVKGPGGQEIGLTPIGDNKYLANIGKPLYGEAKTRYNVGIEYTLDPNTNQLRISNPSIQAFQTTSDGDFIKQAIGILAPFALNALFPGLGASIGSTLAAGASAATQAAIGNAIMAGLSTGVITGDVEKGLIAGALAGGGTYLTNSGALGDVMDATGLGDFRTQFNIPNTSTVTGNLPGIEGFGAAADEVGGALSGGGAVTTPVLTQPTSVTQLPAGGMLTPPTVAPTVPSAFDQAVNTALGGGTELGTFGPVNTGGFGTAVPTTDQLTQSLITAGFSPGTAANIAGATLAGAGAVGLGTAATGLLGTGATTATPTAPVTPTTPTTPSVPGLPNVSNLLPGLSNLNVGGLLGAGIDFAQLQALQREATGLGRQIGGEAAAIGREGAVPFTPYTVTTGAGTGTVAPGAATALASPEFQALRQQQLGLAGQTFGAINPAQAAQTLYGQVEALAAPGRAREQEALLQGLQARGLTGFGQNLPTVGGQVRTVNPLFESLLSAQETARGQQALQAQQFGTQEAARQAALGQGLVTGAQNIDQQALAALNAASTLGQQERAMASRNSLLQAEAALQGLRLRQPYEQIGLTATGQALAGAGSAARGLFGLPTQQGNVLGNLNLGQLFGSRTNTSTLGQGTGPQYGYQDYGIFF